MQYVPRARGALPHQLFLREYIYYSVTQGQNLYSTLPNICKVLRERQSLDLNPRLTNSCDPLLLAATLYCSGSQGAPEPTVGPLKTCFKCLVSQVLGPELWGAGLGFQWLLHLSAEGGRDPLPWTSSFRKC